MTTISHPTIPVRTYYVIFVALMVLLAVTMAASYIPYHAHPALSALAVVIALAIAFTKATLVVLYFMHVRYSPRIVWLYSGAAFVWLGLLIAFGVADYLSRGWLHIPGK